MSVFRNRFFVLIVAIYVAMHATYFFLPSLPFLSDSLSYYQWAEENLRSGTLYPSASNSHLQQEGVVAPVYINMEVAALSLWNNPKSIFLLNALLNLGQFLLVSLIAARLFGERAGIVAAWMYALYLNNLGLVLSNYTELAFGFFLLLSVYLFFTRNGISGLFGSGLSLGLALGVRPTAVAALFAYVVVSLWDWKNIRQNLRKLLLVAAGLCIFIVTEGFYTYHSIDDFVFMSTTGPANLLVGANDQAQGTFDAQILQAPEFQKSTYRKRNEAYRQFALNWIVRHPFRWIATFPQRLYSTYITDDFAVSQLLLTQHWTLNQFIKDQRRAASGDFDHEPLSFRVAFLALNVYHQVFYMSVLIIFLIQIATAIRGKTTSREELLLYLFIIITFLMTLVGTIGSLRYKYNFFIVAFILCSPYVVARITRWFPAVRLVK